VVSYGCCAQERKTRFLISIHNLGFLG